MPVADQLLRVRSPRAGGDYTVSYWTQVTHLAQLNTEEKAHLTTWLIDERSRGVEWPTVTSGTVKYVRSKPSLPVRERAHRLLQYLVELSENLGEEVQRLYTFSSSADLVREQLRHTDLKPGARSALGRSDTAAARSESTTVAEVRSLLEFLAERGWISLARDLPLLVSSSEVTRVTPVTVLVDGYSRVEEPAINLDSLQAFVAMWFD